MAFYFTVKKTEGYSGSDIHVVCKEAAMRPMRKIFAVLEEHAQGNCNCTLCINLAPREES